MLKKTAVAFAMALILAGFAGSSSAQTSPTIPSGGGSAHRITGNDGKRYVRSVDWRSLYYQRVARLWLSLTSRGLDRFRRLP